MKPIPLRRVVLSTIVLVVVIGLGVGVAGGAAAEGPPAPVPPTQPPPDLNAPGAGLAPRPDLPPGTVGLPAPRCTIKGGPKKDVLRGTAGSDVLCGLAGNDRLYAHGSDALIGGAGKDILYARNGEPDYIVGGAGRDRALVDPAGIDTVVGVENVSPTRSLAHNPTETQFSIYSKGWYKHAWVGRIYFTGGQGFCSGSLVAANIVLTAGHCLYGYAGGGGLCFVGGGGAFNSDIANGGLTFVPGQWGQQKPYGEFTSRAATVAVPWSDAFNNCTVENERNVEPNAYYAAYDYAFIVLKPNSSGRNAGDVVGGWFTIAPEYQGLWYWSIGYPSDGWFDTATGGNYPYYCYSKAAEFSKALSATGAVGWEAGIGCLSTGGSSGGPWIVDANGDGRWTEVAGLNSHGPETTTGLGMNMWSPWFTRAAVDLLNYAKRL